MCFRLSSWSHVSIVLFFQSCVVSFKCVLDFQVVLCIIIFVVVVVAVFVFRLSMPMQAGLYDMNFTFTLLYTYMNWCTMRGGTK